MLDTRVTYVCDVDGCRNVIEGEVHPGEVIVQDVPEGWKLLCDGCVQKASNGEALKFKED